MGGTALSDRHRYSPPHTYRKKHKAQRPEVKSAPGHDDQWMHDEVEKGIATKDAERDAIWRVTPVFLLPMVHGAQRPSRPVENYIHPARFSMRRRCTNYGPLRAEFDPFG